MLHAALRDQVLSSVRSHRSPTRAQARSVAALVLGLTGALSLTAFLALGGELAAPGPAAGGTALIATLAWAAAWHRGRSMRARPAWVYRLSLILTPYALALWRAAAPARAPAAAQGPALAVGAGEALSRTASCFGLTLLVALPLLVARSVLRRDSEPTRAGPLGAAEGVAIGALASVLMDLRCGAGALAHLLGGHALPVLLLGLAGELLGWRVMAMRATVAASGWGSPTAAPSTPPSVPPSSPGSRRQAS
jgi:hypothetical protein